MIVEGTSVIEGDVSSAGQFLERTAIVQVTDGQTAVVGGIYQSTETTTVNQTPFLSKIPLLGYLFKNKAVNSQNNELLLFITPRIVKS